MDIVVPPAPAPDSQEAATPATQQKKKKAKGKKGSATSSATPPTGIYTCQYCPLQFTQVKLRNIHYHWCEGKPQKAVTCADCNTVIHNASYLNLHQRNCKPHQTRKAAEEARKRQETLDGERKHIQERLANGGQVTLAEIDHLIKTAASPFIGGKKGKTSSSSTEGSPNKKPRAPKKPRAAKRQKLSETERLEIGQLSLVNDNDGDAVMTDAPTNVAAPTAAPQARRFRIGLSKSTTAAAALLPQEEKEEEEEDDTGLELPMPQVRAEAALFQPLGSAPVLATAATQPAPKPAPKRAPKKAKAKKANEIDLLQIDLVNDSDDEEREARSGDYSDSEESEAATAAAAAVPIKASLKRSRSKANLSDDDDEDNDEDEEEEEEEEVIPMRTTRQSTELAQVLTKLPSELTFASQPATHTVAQRLSALLEAASQIPEHLKSYQELSEMNDHCNRMLYKRNKDEAELNNHSGLFFMEDMANGNMEDYLHDNGAEDEDEEVDLEALMLTHGVNTQQVPEPVMSSIELQKEYKTLEKELEATKKAHNALQHNVRAHRLNFIKAMEPLQEKLKEAGVLKSVSPKNVGNCLRWMRNMVDVFAPLAEGKTKATEAGASSGDGGYKCTICADNKHRFVALNAINCGHVLCEECAKMCRGECPHCRAAFNGYTIVHL